MLMVLSSLTEDTWFPSLLYFTLHTWRSGRGSGNISRSRSRSRSRLRTREKRNGKVKTN